MLQIHQTCLQVRCGFHRFVKLISYHPGRHLEYQILSDALAASWDATRMMSATEESVKSAFYMQIPGVSRPKENFLIFFVINCHFGGHFA